MNFSNHLMKRCFLIVASLLCFAIAGMASTGAAQLSSLSGFFQTNETLIRARLPDYWVSSDPVLTNLDFRKEIEAFYKAADHQPLWITDNQLNRNGVVLLDRFEESWTHGLNPFQYHIEALERHVKSEQDHDLLYVELFLTDALLKYARDLGGMRVNARDLRLDAEHWVSWRGPDGILQSLKERENIQQILEGIEPSGRTYEAIQQELIRLVDTDDEEYSHLLPIRLNGILRPGDGHKSIPAFRERMGLEAPERSAYFYDDDLAAAIIAFQKDRGLKPDGVIGSQTIRAMNVTREDRIRQMIVNLERLRWLDGDQPDRYVVVNVPSATLWAIDSGDVKLKMPVIVGNPARQTRIFRTDIRGMRFNPDWTIPPTIKRKDILPELQANPEYVMDKGITLIRGYGSNSVILDPHGVDWHDISWPELNRIRMVQEPGQTNPLGRFRVLMPNVHNIYLHDTNKPQYFQKTERALSSGCLRMKYPDDMARFIMRNEDGWSEDKMQSILVSGKKTDISIDRPIPVYILYYTVWLDDNDRLVYGHDIYNRDKKLIDALAKIDGFVIPSHNRN